MPEPVRQQVWWVNNPDKPELGPKPWLVVSNNQRNRNLNSVAAVRITTSPKKVAEAGKIATIVALPKNPAVKGAVLADTITDLPKAWFDKQVGALSQGEMKQVEAALRIGLGL